MSKTKLFLTGALFALVALALVLAPTPALAAKKNMAKAKGYISAIDTTAGTVTIADKESGLDVVVTVEPSTRIHKNKVEGADIEDLVVGDKAHAKYNADTMVAKRIQAKSPKAHGEITAVDVPGNSVTIQPAVGLPITVVVTEATKIKRNHERVELGDLVVGDQAKAKYDPGTMEAKHIHAFGQ